MSLKRALVFGALAVGLAACGNDNEGELLPQERIGAVRFVHALPDTRALDFRVVDIPSNTSLFQAPYRSTKAFHEALRAGNRSFRTFIYSTHPDTAQMTLMDIQHNIVEGTRYTIYLTGLGAGGQQQPFITEDNAPDVGTGSYTIRVTHVGQGMGPVDAIVVTEDAEVTVATNVGFRSSGAYTTVATGTGHTLEIREAGTATVVASMAIPAGAAPTATGQTAIPGTTQGGTGITAMLFAPSVAGTLAAQFANPGITFVYDRRP